MAQHCCSNMNNSTARQNTKHKNKQQKEELFKLWSPTIVHPVCGFSQRERKAMLPHIRAMLSLHYGSSVYCGGRLRGTDRRWAAPTLRTPDKVEAYAVANLPCHVLQRKKSKKRTCVVQLKRPERSVYVLKHLPSSNLKCDLFACKEALQRSCASSIAQFRLKVLKTTNVRHAWTDLLSKFVLVAEFSRTAPKPAFVCALRWAVHTRYKHCPWAAVTFKRKAFAVEERPRRGLHEQKAPVFQIHCLKKQRRLRRAQTATCCLGRKQKSSHTKRTFSQQTTSHTPVTRF